MISYKLVLEKVGDHGLAQVLLVLMLGYNQILAGYNSLAAVFVGYTPDFRCNVPPIDNGTAYPGLSEDDILNLTTPMKPNTQEYATCQRYGYDLASCDGTLDCVDKSAPSIACDHGYYYDRSVFSETTVTEFDLVCDRSYLNPLSSSMYYVGMLIGSLVFGDLSDRFGRKPAILSTYIIAIGCMFGVTYSYNVEMFMVFRSLSALFGYASTIGGFVYVVESVGPAWRTVFGIAYGLFFTYGYMILGGIAALYRNWQNLYLVLTLTCIPFILPILLVPESPRWLLAKNKDEEGKRVVRLMARLNRRKIDEMDFEKSEEVVVKKEQKPYTILDLFRKRRIFWLTVKVTLAWFFNSAIYYGISLNAGSLDGDIFINNTLNGVLEIVAHIVVYFQMQTKFFGRRLTESSMFFLACGSLVASILCSEFGGDNASVQTFGTVMAFMSKFAISSSFSAIYYITCEVYPTVARATGLATGSVFARVGGIAAPYLIYLQDYVVWLPNLIFAVGAFIAGILTLFIPETRGKPMMETMEQAEIFYRTGEVVVKRMETKETSFKKDVNFTNQAFESHCDKDAL